MALFPLSDLLTTFYDNVTKALRVKSESTNKNVIIGKAITVSVEPGVTTTIINAVDIKDFPYIYLTRRAKETHDHITYIIFHPSERVSSGMGGQIAHIGAITAQFSGVLRGYTDWIEAKGDRVTIQVTNRDTVARSYDFFLYGVR